MPNMKLWTARENLALENLLSLNIYTGSAAHIVPWLLAPAIFCLAVTWAYTRHGFRPPVRGSRDPANTAMAGICILLRALQLCAFAMAVFATTDYATRPTILFEDEISPTWFLKMSLLYPAFGRFLYNIFIAKVVCSHAIDRSSTLSNMLSSPVKFLLVGSLLVCHGLAAFVCVSTFYPYEISWSSSRHSTADGTLGNYTTLVVLGQALCGILECPMIAAIAAYVISANCYKKHKTMVKVFSVFVLLIVPLSLLKAAYFIHSMLHGRLPKDNMDSFANQLRLLFETYVIGNLYLLVWLYMYPLDKADDVEAKEPVEEAEKV